MQIWDFSAADMAREFRRRTLSPVEVVRALLNRAQVLEPAIRAWQTLDGDAAMAAAVACERQYRADRDDTGALLGVPFGVKDIIFTAGLRTSAGSPLYSDFVPTYDATVVAHLKAAGAIVLGKTITTQFAFVDPVPTRNPWDKSRTPGFSSSGSVAAVAARMVPVGLGTQTGGSTVRPSAYCGVVGLKPTFGRIGRRGLMPLSWSLDDIGLIARSVEDVGLLLDAAAGKDRTDPTASKRAVGEYRDAGPLDDRAPRIGLLSDLVETADPTVRQHIHETVRRLVGDGARVREIASSVDFAALFAVQQILLASEAAAAHGESVAGRPDTYAPRLRALIEAGGLIPASVYLNAQRLRRQARPRVAELFRGVDCLLLPSQSCPAPSFGGDVDATLQAPWTLLGLPAMNLPTGLSPDRLPLGIQLVGRPFGEDRLLRVARWTERLVGRFPAAPV